MQSILGNLPTYYLSLFVALQGVIDKLEKIGRQLLWGSSEGNRKIHWASWDKVIASKDASGLGVGIIKSLNVSLIMKWWWRLRSGPTSIWADAIIGLHNLRSKPDN